jgi:hypothetical protein
MDLAPEPTGEGGAVLTSDEIGSSVWEIPTKGKTSKSRAKEYFNCLILISSPFFEVLHKFFPLPINRRNFYRFIPGMSILFDGKRHKNAWRAC